MFFGLIFKLYLLSYQAQVIIVRLMYIFLQLESKILIMLQINISVYSYIIDKDFLNIVYFKIIWFSKRY